MKFVVEESSYMNFVVGESSYTKFVEGSVICEENSLHCEEWE